MEPSSSAPLALMAVPSGVRPSKVDGSMISLARSGSLPLVGAGACAKPTSLVAYVPAATPVGPVSAPFSITGRDFTVRSRPAVSAWVYESGALPSSRPAAREVTWSSARSSESLWSLTRGLVSCQEPSSSISRCNRPPPMEVTVVKMAVTRAHESAMPSTVAAVRARLRASERSVNRVRMPMARPRSREREAVRPARSRRAGPPPCARALRAPWPPRPRSACRPVARRSRCARPRWR